MKVYKDVECVYSYRDENMNLKGGKYNCFIVSKDGSISFGIEEVKKQLLISQNVLKKALKKKISLETRGILMTIADDIVPIECKVHINVMPLVTNMYVVDLNYSIGMNNFILEKIVGL